MPDLNSVPASPHSLVGSRRASANPMPLPSPSLNILPSNQSTVNQPRRPSNASLPSPHFAPGAPNPISPPTIPESNTISGPGPVRHPRPLTAAELHVQLEKEQEAVVNRLTRELQLLRAAHNASTVSNASSTSAGNSANEQISTPADASLLTGSGFSIPSTSGRRHNRTSSSTSIRSLAANQGSVAPSISSIPIRPTPNPAPMSRQDSAASHRSYAGSSPAAEATTGTGYFHPTPRNPQHSRTGSQNLQSHGHEQGLSPGLLAGTSRYEETMFHREQLEATLQENEALKRRIRELERMVRERRRSESVSTTTSTGVGAAGVAAGAGAGAGAMNPPPVGAGMTSPRERPAMDRERSMTAVSVGGQSIASSVAVGVPEEEVQVGESASNAGLASQSQGH